MGYKLLYSILHINDKNKILHLKTTIHQYYLTKPLLFWVRPWRLTSDAPTSRLLFWLEVSVVWFSDCDAPSSWLLLFWLLVGFSDCNVPISWSLSWRTVCDCDGPGSALLLRELVDCNWLVIWELHMTTSMHVIYLFHHEYRTCIIIQSSTTKET